MYTTRVAAPARPPGAALGREPVGPRSGARARPRRPGAREPTRSRCARTRRPGAGRCAHRRALGIGPSARAGRGARRRGQRVPPLAGGVVRRGRPPRCAAAQPNRRIILTTGPPQAAAGRGGPAPGRRPRGGAGAVVVALRSRSGRAAKPGGARARCFIGGDSGPAHIASTTTTPMVVIFGPTTPAVWGPWRDPGPGTEIGGRRRAAVPAVRSAACASRAISGACAASARRRSMAAAARALEREPGDGAEVVYETRCPTRTGRPVVAATASCAALQVSIAAAQILLALIVAVLARGCSLTRPRALRGAAVLPAARWSTRALTLLGHGLLARSAGQPRRHKQLLLFLIVPVVYTFARGARARTVMHVIITVGAASAVVGIVQYGILHYDNLGQRPAGHARPLHDLLGPADAGHRRRWRACCSSRATASGRRSSCRRCSWRSC